MLDVFRGDAFTTVSLTDAINKAPYKPGRIGQLGLFRSAGIRTTTVVVEEKDGQLELIQTSPRGGPGTTLGNSKRTARPFVVPHLEKESVIKADEVQGVRVFGSEDQALAVQTVVDERLATLRQMHEVTLEHLRVGAIKGSILDADGTTELLNLFTGFDVSQSTYVLGLLTPADDIRSQAVAIQRLIESVMGATPISGYRAFCGDDFFDELVGHATVKASFQNQEGVVLRSDLRSGFQFGGIMWENYRGRVGTVDFFPSDEAYVVPEGTDIFQTKFAPADFIETVNTLGLPSYAKIVPDGDLNRFVKVHTQSNPLALCLRPDAVVKVTIGT
jgi:hypothetical protein